MAIQEEIIKQMYGEWLAKDIENNRILKLLPPHPLVGIASAAAGVFTSGNYFGASRSFIKPPLSQVFRRATCEKL